MHRFTPDMKNDADVACIVPPLKGLVDQEIYSLTQCFRTGLQQLRPAIRRDCEQHER